MESNNKNIDILIINFLTDDISDKDLLVLEDWKHKSPENLRTFNQSVQLWNHSKSLQLFDCINPVEDWEKVKTKFSNSTKEEPKIIKASFKISRVAAILLPLLLIGSVTFSLYWNVAGFGRWELAKTQQTKQEVTLPDSSVVELNKNSSLKYLAHFTTSKERLVELKGEAFFRVTHDKNKPFIVKADELKVKVLGTEFNIKESNYNTVVSVISGKVKVDAQNKQQSVLIKGEKVTYSDNVLNKENTNIINDIYWYTGKLEFKQASLDEICKVLKNAFPEVEDITNSAKPSKIRLTTCFENQSLKDIIEELHIHFGKKFTFDGKVLTISD